MKADADMLSVFLSLQREQLNALPGYKRYLYPEIDNALKGRLTGIVGSRGTGKTTLMLQVIKEYYGNSDKALYVSVDHPYFEANPLYEFAEYFFKYGGKLLSIDEVHKYPNWSSHIKAIYDGIPGLKLIFSGSSILQMDRQKGDLSRRALIYNLAGLSFREYINLAYGFSYKDYKIEEILKNHITISSEIISVITAKGLKILPLFREYLEYGYYPFILEGKEFYRQKLAGILNQILEVDLPFASSIPPRQISKIKKLLYLLAKSVPFTPDITELARSTDISRPTVYDYFEKLVGAKIILMLQKTGRGYDRLLKPEKLYLENTNIMSALSISPDIGTTRETFFANQIINAYTGAGELPLYELIAIPKKGDFIINEKWTFEIGGRNKKRKQISEVKNSLVLADDIETGYGEKIPLWLFGFLY